MRHHEQAKDGDQMIKVDSIFRQQEYLVESNTTEERIQRNEWASITRASVLCDQNEEMASLGRNITRRAMLYAEDSLMQLRMFCSEDESLLEDVSDIEVDNLIFKSATFPLSPSEQPQTERPEVFKIIDKESVELTLDNTPSSNSSKAAAAKEVYYEEEIRQSFDDDFASTGHNTMNRVRRSNQI